MIEKNKKVFKSLIRSKPSPLLLEESKASFAIEFAYDYIKSICCSESESFCNSCEVCLKIENINYFDCYFVNAYEQNISKEEMAKIITNFSLSSLEKYNNKFLIVYGAEKLNKQISNMLLKSIESPSKNTFYIFITRNYNSIINTIRSRCVFYKVNSDIDKFKEILMEKEIDDKYLDFFVSNFYSVREVLNFYKSENFLKIIEIYNMILEKKTSLTSIYKAVTKFKTLSYYEISVLLILLEPYAKNEKKETIYYLINSLKYNINKTLVFNEILSLV
ncbi:MAG: DNA polymerase III subunit delta' [Malacoplasma sp.]|nr:DNA polymerase III subunit delta' [Malacoplasma sp.]